jgi:hypothetical protein
MAGRQLREARGAAGTRSVVPSVMIGVVKLRSQKERGGVSSATESAVQTQAQGLAIMTNKI